MILQYLFGLIVQASALRIPQEVINSTESPVFTGSHCPNKTRVGEELHSPTVTDAYQLVMILTNRLEIHGVVVKTSPRCG